MFWLIYCALFGLMLLSIVRMLIQRGKWAWWLFLGLIASAGAYVGLFIVPVASMPSLQGHHVILALILIGGTLLYAAGTIYFVRKMSLKLKPTDVSPQ